jgi:hypothetical protein
MGSGLRPAESPVRFSHPALPPPANGTATARAAAGARLGEASCTDFLIFAATVERIEHGVVLSFGSAVMAPEVYLKALSMARNVALQQERSIRRFTTAVFDLHPAPPEIRAELPKTAAGYYFRPHKTMLVRTVADGGESFYLHGDHRATLPALRRALLECP